MRLAQEPTMRSRRRARAAAIVFFTLLVMINLIGFQIRTGTGGVGPLDMRTDFTEPFMRASLESYELAGVIGLYRNWFIPVDVLFIASYVTAGVMLARRLRPGSRALVALAVITGVADALENLTVLLLLSDGVVPGAFFGLTVFTLVKDIGLILYLGWIAAIGIRALIRRLRHRPRQTGRDSTRADASTAPAAP